MTIPMLQVIAESEAAELPRWHFEEGPAPDWVERISRAAVLGYVDVVSHDDVFLSPTGTFQFAIDLDSVMYAWRDDGFGVWTIVSVWFPDEDW